MTAPAPEFAPWLGVFETLHVVDGVPLFMEEHREELASAMEALELASAFDFEKARAALPRRSGRWRWIVTPQETHAPFYEEVIAPSEPVALSISSMRVGSHNWDARYKTVSYLSHIQARRIALTPETVLLNEHGHVASCAGANIFWRKGEHLFTPSRESGCRHGVVRRFVLGRDRVRVGEFPVADLLDADEIFFTNSLKGIVSVNALESRSLADFSCADRLRVEYEGEVAKQINEASSP